RLVEVRVPDMGNFKDVAVIDVLVKPGETIEPEAPLVTLETEKATMDVPSTASGVVEKVHVAKGGKVSPGDLVVTVRSDASAEASPQPAASAGTAARSTSSSAASAGSGAGGAFGLEWPRCCSRIGCGFLGCGILLEASSSGRTRGRAGKGLRSGCSALFGERRRSRTDSRRSAADQRTRILARSCRSFGAPACTGARRRSDEGQRHGIQRTHHA